jgi:hypothetical protein
MQTEHDSWTEKGYFKRKLLKKNKTRRKLLHNILIATACYSGKNIVLRTAMVYCHNAFMNDA